MGNRRVLKNWDGDKSETLSAVLVIAAALTMLGYNCSRSRSGSRIDFT
jgi:hypothetical protein